jgi:hypothetical protein
MQPHQVISLENLPGPTSFALPDHYNHVHIGYRPLGGPLNQQFNTLLSPGQWLRLTKRLGQIKNPRVPTSPSSYSLHDGQSGHGTSARSGGNGGGNAAGSGNGD